MVIPRRCAVVVSALAIFAAFLWAPYEHVHTTTDVRHSHVSPHEAAHQHDTPGTPDPTPHGKDDVLEANVFLSSEPGATAPDVAVISSPVPVIDLPRTRHDGDVEEPRAHGPPTRPRSPRAPPLLPAF